MSLAFLMPFCIRCHCRPKSFSNGQPQHAQAGKDDTDDKCNESTAVQHEIDNFRKEVLSELRSLNKSFRYCGYFCHKVAEVNKDVKEVIKEIKKLKLSNLALRKKNTKLAQRFDELELYSGSHNAEIRNVTIEQDVSNVFLKLGESLGEPVSKDDRDVRRPVSKMKQYESNILGRFCREKRNSFFL